MWTESLHSLWWRETDFCFTLISQTELMWYLSPPLSPLSLSLSGNSLTQFAPPPGSSSYFYILTGDNTLSSARPPLIRMLSSALLLLHLSFFLSYHTLFLPLPQYFLYLSLLALILCPPLGMLRFMNSLYCLVRILAWLFKMITLSRKNPQTVHFNKIVCSQKQTCVKFTPCFYILFQDFWNKVLITQSRLNLMLAYLVQGD